TREVGNRPTQGHSGMPKIELPLGSFPLGDTNHHQVRLRHTVEDPSRGPQKVVRFTRTVLDRPSDRQQDQVVRSKAESRPRRLPSGRTAGREQRYRQDEVRIDEASVRDPCSSVALMNNQVNARRSYPEGLIAVVHEGDRWRVVDGECRQGDDVVAGVMQDDQIGTLPGY